jgi:Leucine-rich repeat (LRR) protein
VIFSLLFGDVNRFKIWIFITGAPLYRFGPKKAFCSIPHCQMIKNDEKCNSIVQKRIEASRKTGSLNISNQRLQDLPPDVFNLHSTETKWWEIVEMKKIIAADNQIQKINPLVGELKDLTVLDLHNNEIQEIPRELNQESLKILNLSTNKLNFVSLSGSLIDLNVKENQLKTLELNLNLLRNLNASHNQLNEFDFMKISNISKLNLSFNLFQRITNLNYLYELEELNLSNCRLTEIDAIELEKLKVLDLRNNLLVKIHLNAPNLVELYAGFNKLTHFEYGELKCPNLQVIDFRDNNLASVPKDILYMNELRRLDISNNSLKMIPPQMSTLQNLKVVYFSGNPLRGYPTDSFSKLKDYLAKKLTIADIPDHKTPLDLDSRVSICSKLEKRLNWSSRGLKSVVTKELIHAQEIDLSSNFLVSLPDDFNSLNLKSLDISKNRLTNFNFSFELLTHLNLSRNMLIEFPQLNLPVLNELNLNGNKYLHINKTDKNSLVSKCFKLASC